MAKTPIQIDKQEYATFLAQLENTNTFSNRSNLWKAVEATEWAKSRSPRPLTAQVAMLLAQKFNIELKTPMGRRGIVAGQPRPIGAGRKRKEVKVNIFNEIAKFVPSKYEKRLNRLKTGSLKAAIALKCLDCCAYQQKEVAECTCVACPLYPFRPFKRSNQNVESNTSTE